MKCLSCHRERASKVVASVMLCPPCAALAEKLEREITKEIERARGNIQDWLTQHVLRGGLLRGGTGVDTSDIETARAAIRKVLGRGQVPELRGAETVSVAGGGAAASGSADNSQDS